MLQLRAYQAEAKLEALKYDGFGLFLEQRTGKTPLACEIVQARNPERLLIACPKIAIPVWEKHLNQYKIKAETRIMTYESLWRARKKLKRWKPDFIIGDETHRIKDRTSKQSRALRMIARVSHWRLALTGTPLEGKIWDVWAQYDFIDPTIFGPWKKFKEDYLIYGGYMGYKIVGTRNGKDFQRKFHSRMFRVLLEDVKPEKTDIAPPNVIHFDLVESRHMYDSMEQKFIVDLGEMSKKVRVKVKRPDGTVGFVLKRKRIVAPRVITQAMKLHQLSGGFILDEERNTHWFGSEKLVHCGALLLKLGKVPVVIFVRFLPELYRLAALCKLLGRTVTLLSGAHEFTGFKTDVIIVQQRSGVAIDLSRAEEAIFYSWNYSYLDYDQAKFRIRSYTSKRARYHYLVARHTIDEDLLETVTRKLNFCNFILNKYRRPSS